ncbi:LytR/AlgR family response regulator transcription factor [Arcticibacterium luteifluviistationis]|uniref:DNA-binding response regulator n=1 Tax=Arcticibacterium luteifluviistationis TaxID=1784714 RepID=A0A2Z4GAL6_9BACT|nr:LytTR family DNA-binding domain-containing protein [Arcticibacterium luteifluviistationis]AWV98118.1 DNA-binding response regulator [Arcticibacterium luteifluviistationis]
MPTCVLIDDENRSIDTLKTIIENFLDEDLKILGTANSAKEGYQLILKTKPQIVFLDIEMPHQTGFDMLELFEKIDFEVIFTTGFDQYAITAIKFSALDYLLKPINIGELQLAVTKAVERFNSKSSANQIQNLLDNIKSPKDSTNKIPLPVMNGLEMVQVGQIVNCEASQDYTIITLAGGKQVLVSRSIKYFEELLTDYNFFRTHHSHLVNKEYIKKYVKGEGGYVITESGKEIPVSRRKKPEFLNWLKH